MTDQLIHASDADAVKPLKVFILAGQSNMVGKRSKRAELPEELQKEQSNAFFFSGSDWVRIKPGVTEVHGFGPEISFCERISQTLGEPFGIIKVSVGGTSLATDWSPRRPNSLYGKLRALTEKAGQTRLIKIVGMVWMQGGRDAKDAKKSRAYKTNLDSFINQARTDFNNSDMAFVCGRTAAPPDKYPNVKYVREAQESVSLPNYAWVDCDSISTGSDRVHYSTKGQVQTGYLFADAMVKLFKAMAK